MFIKKTGYICIIYYIIVGLFQIWPKTRLPDDKIDEAQKLKSVYIHPNYFSFGSFLTLAWGVLNVMRM